QGYAGLFDASQQELLQRRVLAESLFVDFSGGRWRWLIMRLEYRQSLVELTRRAMRVGGLEGGVFGAVGAVDPGEGEHEHIVERGHDIPHQAHEKKRQLENLVLEKVERR